MKILIVDNDEVATQFITSRLEPVGFQVFVEPTKETAVERAIKDRFDIIMMDPAPLNSARQHVLNIRRNVMYYPYFILINENACLEAAIESGMNDFVKKPIDQDELSKKLYNAEDLERLVERFADETEDFPSARGIISKSAFNQIFLSTLERADRYGEKAFLMFISLSNYKEIVHEEGLSSGDNAVAHLCKNISELRRQSDIVGQTAKNEYSILLQRPNDDSEPIMAANRYAQMLVEFNDMYSENGRPFELHVKLVEVPSGKTDVEHNVRAPEKAA